MIQRVVMLPSMIFQELMSCIISVLNANIGNSHVHGVVFFMVNSVAIIQNSKRRLEIGSVFTKLVDHQRARNCPIQRTKNARVNRHKYNEKGTSVI